MISFFGIPLDHRKPFRHMGLGKCINYFFYFYMFTAITDGFWLWNRRWEWVWRAATNSIQGFGQASPDSFHFLDNGFFYKIVATVVFIVFYFLVTRFSAAFGARVARLATGGIFFGFFICLRHLTIWYGNSFVICSARPIVLTLMQNNIVLLAQERNYEKEMREARRRLQERFDNEKKTREAVCTSFLHCLTFVAGCWRPFGQSCRKTQGYRSEFLAIFTDLFNRIRSWLKCVLLLESSERIQTRQSP